MTTASGAASRPSLLIVSYAFPPALAAESIMLLKKVRALASRFRMTIVTQDPETSPFPSDRTLERYVPSDVDVVRVAGVDGRRVLHRAAHLALRGVLRGSGLVRYLDVRWARTAAHAVPKRLAGARFDLMMTNSQNLCSHLAGHWLQPALGLPWIQHYSDPVVDSAARRHDWVSSAIDGRLVRRFLRNACLVTMPTEEMRDRAFGREIAVRTAVVPHSYDRQMMRDALAAHPDRLRYFADSESVHVCYVGNLYGTRGADLVVEATRRLSCRSDSRPIVTHVFGRLNGRSRRELARSPVVFHGGVDYLESLAIMQHADALLLVDVPVDGSPFFPSKLADYLGTSKPIVVVAARGSAVLRIATEMRLTCALFNGDPIAFDLDVTAADLERRLAYGDDGPGYAAFADRATALV